MHSRHEMNDDNLENSTDVNGKNSDIDSRSSTEVSNKSFQSIGDVKKTNLISQIEKLNTVINNGAIQRLTKELEKSHIFKINEALSKATLPHLHNANALVKQYRHIAENPAISSLHKISRDYEKIANPITLDSSKILREYNDKVKPLSEYLSKFRLPAEIEINGFLKSYQSATAATNQYFDNTRKISEAMRAMDFPWVRNEEAFKSFDAFTRLQGIGSALQTGTGFDDQVTAFLRNSFGDWRDTINWPENLIEAPARTDFYIGQGYDSSLADFPETAFHKGLTLAGFDDPLSALDTDEKSEGNDHEEEGIQRTNRCHLHLSRFERRIQRFINDAMTAQYGPDWPKIRLPQNMLESWIYKIEQAGKHGRRLTYIEAADFTDYLQIIVMKEHWNLIFSPIFKRKESITESFQRLYPIRITTMHAGLVTQDDVLFMAAEIRRITSALQ